MLLELSVILVRILRLRKVAVIVVVIKEKLFY